MARVAVGADRALGIVRILHAPAFLRDPFAVLPVAQVLAVGGPLDRRKIGLLDAVPRRPSAAPCRHIRCRSSACRPARGGRASPVPARVNEALSTVPAWAETSASLGAVAQPTRIATAPRTRQRARRRWFAACIGATPSALDRGRVERGAVRVAGEEHGQRNRRVRREDELREPLLAKAVVQPPLERAQLALRHAVRRPRRVGLLRAGLVCVRFGRSCRRIRFASSPWQVAHAKSCVPPRK